MIPALLLTLACSAELEATASDPETSELVDPAEAERLRAENERLRAENERLRASDPVADPTGADYTSYAGDVVVPEGETAANAVSFQGDVRVDGHVTGSATAFAGDVVIGPRGVVDGDAASMAGDVVVEPGGQLQGNRVALGGGRRHRGGPPHHAPPPSGFLDGLSHRLVMILSFAGAGVLTVGIFPKRVGAVAATVERRPVHSAAVGAFATVFGVLASVLLTVVTLGIGLPIGLLVLGALGVAWLLGFMGLCQAVGDHLPFDRRPHGRWVAFLVGVLLVTSIASLPWVGEIVLVGVGLLGVGAALSSRFGATPA